MIEIATPSCAPPGAAFAAEPEPVRNRSSGTQVLSAPAIDEMLRDSWWGILSTTVDNQPYAVPVAYGWNGTHVFIASLDGRKIRNLQANPNACLTIANVESGANWSSAIVEGPIQWVKSPGQLLVAFHALATQCGKPFVAPPPSRLLDARVFRIIPKCVSGRARAPER